ncbi:MAG: hypothetical protein DMG28_02395 [Acidobacteria bacterium]|nr:MAG: hypothetical protein DMG28_02395 [Acidobacteriota bacterium]
MASNGIVLLRRTRLRVTARGDLLTNYESSLVVSLQLANAADTAILTTVEQVLDSWSSPVPGNCQQLIEALLNQLAAAGLVRSEAQLAAIAQQAAIRSQTGMNAGY